ncbi:MAG: YtxH domain-containing protein [Eggerthellaceae bacterium]|nr:YtxH domain-containing protein [Eggerthellaceae bacterium]
MAGRIGFFIIGGIVGAAAALLYAPRTGEETRAYMADKANEAWGNAQSAGTDAQSFYEEAKSRGQEVYQSAAETASAAYTRAAATAQDAINSVQEKIQGGSLGGVAATAQNDELREKIEAARQRIASQVAKNAEAAKSAGEEVVVEAEAVIEQEAEKAEGAAAATGEDASESK